VGWQRHGRIFDPALYPDKVCSHAQVPTVLDCGDQLRIYYADRTPANKSFMCYIDVDAEDPSHIIDLHSDALLSLGAPGTFDDDGAMPACAVRVDGRVFLYYSGWNRGVTVPYRNSIGIAVSEDDGRNFRRMYEGPVMDRTAEEPYIAVTPSIVRGADSWRMWYISGLRWVPIAENLEPVYVIKYAESLDGIRWVRPNHQCLPQRHPFEAFSHPSVIQSNGVYHMWFCSRDSSDFRDGAGAYRIGYARSSNGLDWERDDEFGGLGVSDEGWDSTMTAYPYVVVGRNGKVRMFYNGNSFGRSGIGYAEWEGPGL
jgi:hypothetical protein